MSESTVRDDELAAFAAAPESWGEPRGTLTGPDAAAFGRGLLEAAGVDVVAVERSVGRPRVGGGTGRRGQRSPRVNVTVSEVLDAMIDAELARRHDGSTRSDIVREALDDYLTRRAS
jgi:hypothetical protein